MRKEKFFVTGSMGCLGAWVIRHLIDEGADFVASDLGEDPVRPRLLLSDDELASVPWHRLDVTDSRAVMDAFEQQSPTHIIHLAGLQVPFCKANPPLGAAVNVVGTVNIFEAARRHSVDGLAYASSLAVLGPPDLYDERPVLDDVQPAPTTLYGVYKTANEETARLYWDDWNVGSIGLRPYNVFGVARDQGMTADIAKSILATAAGRPFHIRYDGPLALQHASDVARIFIACARANHQGAAVCNLRNDVTNVASFVETLTRLYPTAQVTREAGQHLPFPADLSDAGLRSILGTVPHTPLDQAIADDFERYCALIAGSRIDLAQLET